MTPWESYLPEVLPFISKGVPEPFATKAIRDAAIDFCKRSLAWSQELDPVPAVAGNADYDLDTPDDAIIVQVKKVLLGDDDLTPGDDGLCRYAMVGTRTLRLDPVPDETEGATSIVVTAALAPTKQSYEGPDSLYEEWAEAIGAGALAILFGMKGRDWYDPNEEAKRMAYFNAGINGAKGAILKGRTRAPLRTRSW